MLRQFQRSEWLGVPTVSNVPVVAIVNPDSKIGTVGTIGTAGTKYVEKRKLK
jgi:hypothetical protein